MCFYFGQSANMEREGPMSYAAASHQEAIQMFWLHFWGYHPLTESRGALCDHFLQGYKMFAHFLFTFKIQIFHTLKIADCKRKCAKDRTSPDCGKDKQDVTGFALVSVICRFPASLLPFRMVPYITNCTNTWHANFPSIGRESDEK